MPKLDPKFNDPASLKALDQLIDWLTTCPMYQRERDLMRDPREKKGVVPMSQYTYRIEFKVDFTDRDAHPEMMKYMEAVAKQVISMAGILPHVPKTIQAMVMGGDYFTPPEQINVMEDLITKGEKQINAAPEDDIYASLAADIVKLNANKEG